MGQRISGGQPLLLRDSSAPKLLLVHAPSQTHLQTVGMFWFSSVLFLKLVKIHTLWPCFLQLVSGRFDCITSLLVRCKSSWPRYTAFVVTVPIYFSIFLDSVWLSGNVQTLLFPGEECHFHTWEIEPNNAIGLVEEIPKWLYH